MDDTRWTIRRATASDAVACVADYRAWISETGWMPMVHDAASMRRFWAGRFGDAEGWVVAEGEDIAGFALIDAENLDALYLAPHARRQGIGRSLLRLAKDGRDRLTLWAFQHNRSAIAFYENHGFHEIERTNGDNEEGLPDVRMEWTAGTV